MRYLFGFIFFLGFCFVFPAQATIKIAGPWVELRKSPGFTAPTYKLSPVWGPALPVSNNFIMQKSYGRWIYGVPEPLKKMHKKDYAPAGWIYNQQLLSSESIPIRSPAVFDEVLYTGYYGRAAYRSLGLSTQNNIFFLIDFLESLSLSKEALQAFQDRDEKSFTGMNFSIPFITSAFAKEKPKPMKKHLNKDDPLGLSGLNLDFLKQESKKLAMKRKEKQEKAEKEQLQIPDYKNITDQIKFEVLGRYLAEQKFQFPPLSQNETDGSLYLQALAFRALSGCPDNIKSFWNNRHFLVLRAKNLIGKENQWVSLRLPGNFIVLTNRVIALATNEAELSYAIIHAMVSAVREDEISAALLKDWPKAIQTQSEVAWNQITTIQSMKKNQKLDVADFVIIDKTASECIAKAGYNYTAAITYLAKLRGAQEETWSNWFYENNLGMPYRIQRLQEGLNEATLSGAIPKTGAENTDRFERAREVWNIAE